MADEIVAVYRAEVDQYKKAVDELVGKVNKLDKDQKTAGETAQKMGSKFKGLGRDIVAAFGVTAGIAGFVSVMRGAFNAAKNFEAQMSKVRAISGATAAEMDKLEASAKALGASTMFTATQVGQLQEEYARLGFTTKEILAATGATLDLAAATGETLAASAQVAGATVRGFGLDASETGRVADVMALSFSKSALNLSDFAEGMKLVAPIARAANIPLETTTALMGKLADSGLRGSIAGTALKNLLSKLADENSDLSKELGFSVKNTDDLYKAFQELSKGHIDLTKATELTDERSKAAFITLLNGIDSVESLKTALDGAGGSAKEMAGIMQNNLAGSITKMSSAWEGFTNQLLGSQGAIKVVVDLLTESITGLTLLIGSETIKEFQSLKDRATIVEAALISAKKSVEDLIKPLAESGDTAGANAKAMEMLSSASDKLATKQKQQKEVTEQLVKAQDELKELVENSFGLDKIRITSKEKEIEQLKLRKIAADTEVQSIESVIGVYERYIKNLNDAGGDGGAIESNVRSISRLNKELKTLKEEFENAEIGSKKYYDTIGKIEAKTKELELIEYEILLLTDLQAANEKARQQQDKYSKSFEETMKMRMDAINAFYDEQQISATREIADAQERARVLEEIERNRLREQITLLQAFGQAATSERLKLAQSEAKILDDADALYKRFLEGQEADHAASLEKRKKAEEEARAKEIKAFLDYADAASQTFNLISQAQAQATQYELDVLERSLEQGAISRAQYDEERKKILRKQAQDAKDLAILQAVIGTAVGVANALPNIPLSIIAGVLGAVQIGIIASEPLPQFATGVIGLQGAGTETSDSILARLSKGESVMTAAETKKYRPLLEGIRKGTLDRIIQDTYVRPAVDAALLNGFADIGKSAKLNASFNDHNLLRAIDRHRETEVGELRMMNALLSKYVRTPKRGYA